MSLMNNGFVRSCLNGFGTGTTAARAVGISVLVVCIGFIAAYYVLLGLWKMSKMLRGKSVPDFKQGPYFIELAAVGDRPSDLYAELQNITGYDAALARKVMGKAGSVVVKGLTEADAADFKTVLEAKGATVTVCKS